MSDMTIPTIPHSHDITSSTFEGRDGFAAVQQAERTFRHAQDRSYNRRTGARAAHVKRVVNAAMIAGIVRSRTPDSAWIIVKYMEVGRIGKVLVDNGYKVWQELDFEHTGTNHFVRLIATKKGI